MLLRRIAAVLAVAATTGYPAAARTWVVNGPNPSASDRNEGSEDAPLRTINAAAQLAQPGDTVWVRAGIYRERVMPARGGTADQPIIYQAAPRETVVVRGSEPVVDWQPQEKDPNVFECEIAGRVDPKFNPYLTRVSIAPRDTNAPARPATAPAPMPLTLGQLFFDGAPMNQATSLDVVRKHENTWIVSPDGRRVVARFPAFSGALSDHLIELSVRSRIFAPRRRGLGHIHVRGFIFEHCANEGPFPQGGAVSPRTGHDWRIEGNTIRFAGMVGLDVGNETWAPDTLRDTEAEDLVRMTGGHHVVEGNIISDNGLCGIEGHAHNGVVIRNNVIERNNRLDLTAGDPGCAWEEWGGIKLHGPGALIEGNLIRDNEAFGIWLDNNYRDSRITRNVVLNNRLVGVFIELGAGPCLIDNNIIAFTRPGGPFYGGMGVYAHDASDITVAHNLILSCADGGVVVRTVSDRLFEGAPVASSRNRILNNIIWNNGKAAISLPFPNGRGEGNVSDYNLLFGAHEYNQGLGAWPALFAANSFKTDLPLEAQYAAFLVARGEGPGLAAWRRQPVMDLPTWRKLMTNDLHSLESHDAVSVHVRPRLPSIAIFRRASFGAKGGPRIAGVERDFLGEPIREGQVVPGPFQNLADAPGEFPLFPVVGFESIPQVEGTP